MNGAPKRTRSCPAHPSRGTHYRPQPLGTPNALRNEPLLIPRNPHAHLSSHNSHPETQTP